MVFLRCACIFTVALYLHRAIMRTNHIKHQTKNQSYVIHTLELGPMDNLIYLIEDVVTKKTAVVDPAWDVSAILAIAQQHDLVIDQILLTHAHHDHINGIEELLEHTECPVHLMKAEHEFWQLDFKPSQLHHGGDILTLGQTEIKMLHTPGHSVGSACYEFGNELITGDTLFVYGCGHCKLAGAEPEVLYNTLKDMKQKLDPNRIILPGHHYADNKSCTMKQQTDGNPFLQFDTADGFIHYREHVHDDTRTYPYQPMSKQHMRINHLLT